MQVQWLSEEMLDAFRALGGTAENVRLDGADGGLSPLDPERPVLLRVPESLLFSLETLEFADGSLRLKSPEEVSGAPRDFFQRYEGAIGQHIFAHAAVQIAALDSLPASLRQILAEDFGLRPLLDGDAASRTANWYMERRAVGRGEGRVLAPVLELARHDPNGLAIEHANGLRIAGLAGNGIRVFHPFHDALAIFQRFGFAAPQPAAFSLPMSFASDGIEISIGRKLHVGDRRGGVVVPQLDVVARDRLALSHLMLGHSSSPRLARGIFCARMRDADVQYPDVQFDRIVQRNIASFLKLLDVLEREKSPVTLSLTRMARHQMEAMSLSIGTRQI
jgi:hypothetical protein